MLVSNQLLAHTSACIIKKTKLFINNINKYTYYVLATISFLALTNSLPCYYMYLVFDCSRHGKLRIHVHAYVDRRY